MFNVCRVQDWPGVMLQNGVMAPQAHIGEGVIFTDIEPKELPIWLDEANGVIYKWQISVDTRSGAAPAGYYTFWDETNDFYTLSATTPMVHEVSYNSAKPNIVKIRIGFGMRSWPGNWLEALICPQQ